MAVCREYRIPHGEFLDWDPSDQDKALAYERFLARRCPSCGTLPSHWVDPETGIGLDQPTWQVDLHQCLGCEQLERASAAIPESAKGVRPRLVPFGVTAHHHAEEVPE